MRPSNVIACMKALGLRPVDNGSDWLESTCPFAPYTHKRGMHDRDRTFACEKASPNLYTCLQCHRKGRLVHLPAAMMSLVHEEEREAYWQLSADFTKVEEHDLLTFDFSEEEEPRPLMEVAYHGVYVDLRSSLEGMAYARSRGFGERAVERLGLLWDPRQARILWPVRDGAGALWGFAGRATDGREPKVRNYHGLKKALQVLGSHTWKPGLPTFVVEGLVGLACLFERGADEVANLGCIMGSTMSRQQASILCRSGGEHTCLLLDPDEAGNEGTVEALKFFSWHYPLHVPAWPEGKDDPDQLTRDDVVDLLDSPIVNPFVFRLDVDLNIT